MAGQARCKRSTSIDLWFQSRMRTPRRDRDRYRVRAGRRTPGGTHPGARALVAFAWAALAEVALAGVGLLWSYQAREASVRAWRWSRDRARSLVVDGWPLMLSSVMVLIYMRIDQVMLAQMGARPSWVPTLRRSAGRVWYFVPTTLVAAVYPRSVEARRQGEQVFTTGCGGFTP